MSLAKSKYAQRRTKKEPNQWLDMTISEGNMTDIIATFLQQISAVPNTKNIERVIVGDLANGFYPLAVATSKGDGKS